jgi:F420H(2)-dependent quinone reductase
MAKVPPRWFVRTAWFAHKALTRATADRVGLHHPTPGGQFGILRLHTTGRRTGRPRAVLLGYITDGDRYVTLAMNGWQRADPAWWLNLKSHPTARVDLKGGTREVVAHEAQGPDRDRLWTALESITGYGDLNAFAAIRGRRTAVVVLTPA